MLIIRPSWPEMYGNLSMELSEPDFPGRSQPNRVIFLFLAFLIAFHAKHYVSSKSNMLLGLFSSIIGIFILPVLVFLLVVFWCYRRLAMYVLSSRTGYIGLMDGSDAYWALDENESRGIINILSYVEYLPKKQGGSDLLTIIRAIIQSRCLTDPNLYKMYCKRNLSEFGYFYWEKHIPNIDEHVRWMDLDTDSEEVLQEYLSACSNNPLPCKNSSFWEVLVGKKGILKDGKCLHPVFFRMHHAIGDGISLVSMFLNSFTDEGKTEKQTVPLQKIQEKKKVSKLLTRDISQLEIVFNKIGKALGVPLGKRNSIFKMHNEFKKINQHFIYTMTGVLEKISVLLYAPIVISTQLFFGRDKNILHGQKCSGKKFICWKSSEGLLGKVKKIKKDLKCHFTDVILIAISNSLENYFSKFGDPTREVTLVIPARLPREEIVDRITTPTNAFTIGMLKLPISCPKKLQLICGKTHKLRTEPHFLVNYWLLKIVCTYFPLTLIKRPLRSEQATIALSNVPGPENFSCIDGHKINDLVFWVPNRETTGVGVSLLSYAGKLNFGFHVDQAMVPTMESAKAITDGFILAIDKMFASVS